MKRFTAAIIVAAGLAVSFYQTAEAGNIKRACLQSDRGRGQTQLCSCIQKVADVTLTRSERSTVSKWFADPHQAQVVRQSASHRDEKLWLRYRAFGDNATRVCG